MWGGLIDRVPAGGQGQRNITGVVMNFGIFNWTILRVERGPAPEQQRRPFFDLQTARDRPVSRDCQKFFVGVIGSEAYRAVAENLLSRIVRAGDETRTAIAKRVGHPSHEPGREI